MLEAVEVALVKTARLVQGVMEFAAVDARVAGAVEVAGKCLDGVKKGSLVQVNGLVVHPRNHIAPHRGILLSGGLPANASPVHPVFGVFMEEVFAQPCDEVFVKKILAGSVVVGEHALDDCFEFMVHFFSLEVKVLPEPEDILRKFITFTVSPPTNCNMNQRLLLFALCATLFCACKSEKTPTDSTKNTATIVENNITRDTFGTLPDGSIAELFTLKNKNGVEAKITNYGGIVVSLKVPDRNGKFEDVVLGYDSLADYMKATPYFGCIVGRYGNRIAKGKFTLDGKEYTLAKNDGKNHLHGGVKGFDKVLWQLVNDGSENPHSKEGHQSLALIYKSPDLEEGYPGNLVARVTYTLTDDNELRIDYQAETDKKTHCNLTNHSYFNLTGDYKRDILSHEMMINASAITPVDKGLIPTGEIKKLDGSPLDFRQPKPIGKDIAANDEQIKFGLGYDHNWALNVNDSTFTLAARVTEAESGRGMEVWTTEPGVQFYSGNFLDGTLEGKGGKMYQKRAGFCLETQHFPDSPNQPKFPSTVLEPGWIYRTTTVYKFFTERN